MTTTKREEEKEKEEEEEEETTIPRSSSGSSSSSSEKEVRDFIIFCLSFALWCYFFLSETVRIFFRAKNDALLF